MTDLLVQKIGGAPGEIRTPDHLVRSQILYPAELRAQVCFTVFLFFSTRPERFELPTTWFVARYSIQLSYGRVLENKIYRRERDSNPRWNLWSHTPLAGERLQPLGHLSGLTPDYSGICIREVFWASVLTRITSFMLETLPRAAEDHA